MSRARTRFATVGVAFVSASALAACSGGASSDGSSIIAGNVEDAGENAFGGQSIVAEDPPSGGTFTWAMSAPVPHLDPSKPIGSSLIAPMPAVFEPLMTLNEKGEAEPKLAKSMESEDQKTWTMTIPTGLTFTDGTPFDAESIVTHVENVASEGSESQQAYQARLIDSMKTEGKDTVVFELKEKWAQFPTVLADISSLAMIPSPAAMKKHGEQFGLNPVGIGPFKVKDFKPGQSVTLEANPDYRIEGEPHVDELKFVTLAEADARISGMQTGQVDGAALRTPADVTSAKDAGLRVLTQPSYNYYTLYLNHQDENLADPDLRKALSMATDRKGITQAVFKGTVDEMRGFLSEDHPYHDEKDNWPGFDEAGAKKLVDAYKQETGESTITVNMTLPAIPEMSRIAAILQQQWEKVGVDLQYKTANPSEMVSAGVSGDYEIQMRDSGIQPETLSRMMINFYGGSPGSIVGEPNEQFDKVLEKGTSNPEERAPAISDLQTELNDWLPQIPITTSIAAVGLSDSVAAFPGSYPSTSVESFRTGLLAVKE